MMWINGHIDQCGMLLCILLRFFFFLNGTKLLLSVFKSFVSFVVVAKNLKCLRAGMNVSRPLRLNAHTLMEDITVILYTGRDKVEYVWCM